MTAVMTGVGVVSPFGVGFPAFRERLLAGGHAVGPIRSFDASMMPVRVAGEVPVGSVTSRWLEGAIGPDPRLARFEAEGRLRDRKLGFALVAAAEAWRQAGSHAAKADLSIALGLEQALLEDFGPLMDGDRIEWSREASGPAVRYRTRADLAADSIEELLGLSGQRVVHVSACAAGGLAVAHAAARIARGEAVVVLCGGADSMVNPLGLGGMARLNATSPRAEPDACRPFDRRRDGLAIGEGAAMFVLESEDHARTRGAPVLARILGWGSTQDGYKATAPRPDGAAARRAMERAIARAGIDRGRIGYVNAHGTGTPLNDPAEALAICGALGPEVPVSSIKGAVGHLMAASGAIELVACLLPFLDGVLPGTAHLRDKDPEIGLEVIGPEPREARVQALLTNSFGFGGQNVSLVLGEP